jgi:hypothetical protein
MTQVYYTREQLILAVLEELKVSAHGQVANADDWDKVDDSLDPILTELSALKVVYVGDPNEIPVEIFNALSQAIARQLCNAFSIPMDEADKMYRPENDPFSPESKLRAMRRSTGTYPPQRPDYM